MIQVTCICGRKLRIGDEYAGQNGQCPVCNSIFTLPAPEPDSIFSNYPQVDLPSPRPAERYLPDEIEATPEPSLPAESSLSLKNHAGEDLDSRVDLFAPVPTEIGILLNAQSTMTVQDQPKTPAYRIGIATVLGIVAFGIAWVCAGYFFLKPVQRLLLSLGLGTIGVIVGILATLFRHTCTYIGKEGISKSTCRGSRENQSDPSLLRFKDAVHLFSESREHRDKGNYTHTSFCYTWKNRAGQICYQIEGTHKSEAGNPPGNHYYHFGRGAEIAWTLYLLETWNDPINRGEPIRFPIGPKDWIEVGIQALTLIQQGQEKVWNYADIRDFQVISGNIRIRRKDAREGWLTSVGIFKEKINRIPNVQVLLYLLRLRSGIGLNRFG